MRKSASGDVTSQQNQWGFGQILAVFLVAGPIVSFVIRLQGESHDDEDGKDASFSNRLRDATSCPRNDDASQASAPQQVCITRAPATEQQVNHQVVLQLLIDIMNGTVEVIIFSVALGRRA